MILLIWCTVAQLATVSKVISGPRVIQGQLNIVCCTPKRDDLSVHVREEGNGGLTALTEMGAFHIERLRLNRPPLVALRRARQKMAQLQRQLTAAQEERIRLQERIAALERELEEVLIQLSRLLSR
jgi:hypothetical protein